VRQLASVVDATSKDITPFLTNLNIKLITHFNLEHWFKLPRKKIHGGTINPT
jgi:hypothetical protein